MGMILKGLNTMVIHVTVEAGNKAHIDAAPILYDIEYQLSFRHVDLSS